MKIFISYAKEDHKIAKKICHDLKDEGFTTWFDSDDLQAGQNWKNTIIQEIKNCSYFLALLSSHSISKRGFVQKELKIALDVLDEFPDSEVFFIPLRIEECDPKNEKLREIHWIDVFIDYENGFKRLLNALPNPRNDNYEFLKPVLIELTLAWLSDDFGQHSYSSRRFKDLYFKHSKENPGVFTEVINEYFGKVLSHNKDCYTEDRIRIVGQIISECGITDSTLLPGLLMLLEEYALYDGRTLNPLLNLFDGVKTCWNNKFSNELKEVFDKHPELAWRLDDYLTCEFEGYKNSTSLNKKIRNDVLGLHDT